jgi:hypothetical protein
MPSPEGEGWDLRSGSLPQRETRGCHVGPLEVVRVILLGGFCVWVGPRVIEKDGWRRIEARDAACNVRTAQRTFEVTC